MNVSPAQPRQPVSFGLDADLHAWLRQQAALRHVSMVELFHEAVTEYRERRPDGERIAVVEAEVARLLSEKRTILACITRLCRDFDERTIQKQLTRP